MRLSILHHLGLGDHIVCHGLVRYYAEKLDVSLFCKHHNKVSVGAMFADLPVKIIPVSNHVEAYQLQQRMTGPLLHILVNDNEPEILKGLTFDEIFFKKADVPFELKWDKFFVPRNKTTEISPPAGPYIVVHQDERFRVNVDSPLPVFQITRDLTENVFDFRAVLENAAELHVIDSTFMFIVDQFKCPGKKFVHRYARPNPLWQLPKLTSDWIILT